MGILGRSDTSLLCGGFDDTFRVRASRDIGSGTFFFTREVSRGRSHDEQVREDGAVKGAGTLLGSFMFCLSTLSRRAWSRKLTQSVGTTDTHTECSARPMSAFA